MSVANEVFKKIGKEEFENLVSGMDTEVSRVFFSDSKRIGINTDTLYTYNVYVLIDTQEPYGDSGRVRVFVPRSGVDVQTMRTCAEIVHWGALYEIGRRELGAEDMSVGSIVTLSGIDDHVVETVGVKINRNTWELSGLTVEFLDAEIDEMAGELDGKFYLDGKEIKR